MICLILRLVCLIPAGESSSADFGFLSLFNGFITGQSLTAVLGDNWRYIYCLMGSMSGVIQRPLLAAAAVAAASVSVDLPDKFSPSKSPETFSSSDQIKSPPSTSPHDSHCSLVSHISVSKLSNLSFVTKVHVPVPDIKKYSVTNLGSDIARSPLTSSIVSSVALRNMYRSAELVKAPKLNPFTVSVPTSASSSEEVLYRWHLPDPSVADVSGNLGCSSTKSRTVVVLLGWLGAKQKHLKRYAEWYTSMGFHTITFTFPMSKILSYQVGGKAEKDIELLMNHLADWLEEEEMGKNLVFHTFSNTGWLT